VFDPGISQKKVDGEDQKVRKKRIHRRYFLKNSLGILAGTITPPIILKSSALGRDGLTPPSDRIVMGCIGVGDMGSGHLKTLLGFQDVRVAAICDLKPDRRTAARQAVNEAYQEQSCGVYQDFREILARPDLEAVLIAVPDHWHALVGLEAARQGKHVYYEKPMGRTAREAQVMRAAVERHGITFQFGTQNRSSQSFRQAIALIRNGMIGQIKTIMIGSALPRSEPWQPTQPVPEGFDYDMWLGPAPWAPYSPLRCTREWTLIYDYSLGCVSGAWGIHEVDVAQWALEADSTGPIEVEGTGVFPAEGIFDTASQWEVEHKYANGVRLIHMDMHTAKRRALQFSLAWMGTLFQGTEGWIYISRRGLFTYPEKLARWKSKAGDFRMDPVSDHKRDFLKALRTGRRPISHIGAAVHSDLVCHQADIAMRLGRRLHWDPSREIFADDEKANRLLSRAMRGPWHL
jgi:predicted dehydrogenase